MTQIGFASRPNRIAARPPAPIPWMRHVLWGILGVFSLGLLAAALYLAPRLATLGLVLLGLGLPIMFLLWYRPEVGLLGLIFLTGSFIPENVVDLRLPIGGGLDLRDLVLIGLFGVACLRELNRGTLKVPWWPVGGPLLLFLVIAVFSALYALVFEHVESNWALGDLRILSLYLSFYITLWSIKRPEQLKILLIGLFIIADLTSVIVYLQQFLGVDNPVLQAMVITRDWRVYQQAGGVRVVPAGQVLMHFMWFVALGLLIFARPNWRLRTFCVMQLLFIGGAHLFTYMRAEWVALIIGLGLALIILAPNYKRHLAKVIIVACGLIPVFIVISVGGALSQVSANPFVAGISARFSSLLAPLETSESGSLQWRAFEEEKALQALGKQPLTGVGLGNRYRNVTTYQGEALGWMTDGNIATGRVSRFTRYVHSSYFSIAVKMGIPGLIVILWFCAAVLLKGFQVYRGIPDSGYKGVVLGVLVGFAGLLFWCYFHAHLIKAESTATIGLMTALIGSIAYMHEYGLASRAARDHSLPVKE